MRTLHQLQQQIYSHKFKSNNTFTTKSGYLRSGNVVCSKCDTNSKLKSITNKKGTLDIVKPLERTYKPLDKSQYITEITNMK